MAMMPLTEMRLSEHRYSEGLTLAKHAHQNAFLTVVVSGDYTETIGRMQQHCKATTVRFMPPGETHANQYSRGARCLHVELKDGLLNRLQQCGSSNVEPGEWSSDSVRYLGRRLLAEFRAGDTAAQLAVEGIVLELLAEMARTSGGQTRRAFPPKWLNQARELLRARFAEALTLEEIAASVGVHAVHLSREFRRYFSCTVGDYLRRTRVENACRLLSSPEPSLADVAFDCGFSDQSHLTRIFRRYLGVTPGQYREGVIS
jgi:AraC family transcriptional regulator